jgi:hypothetical protein
MLPFLDMFGFGGWKEIGRVLLALVALAAIIVGFSYLASSIESCQSGAVDKDLLDEYADAEREKYEKKVEELEEEIAAIRYEIEILWEEARVRAKEREDAHDAIRDAPTIAEIDAVLKRSIRQP